jgi:hypothetical protein
MNARTRSEKKRRGTGPVPVLVSQQVQVEAEDVILYEDGAGTRCVSKVAEDWQGKLTQRGAGADEALQVRHEARERGLLLSRAVEAA